MTIAQRFSAGGSRQIPLESVKRTTEHTEEPTTFSLSRPFHGLRLWLRPNPPMNRWAIVIRRLRRLLGQRPLQAAASEKVEILITVDRRMPFLPQPKTLEFEPKPLRSR